MFQSELWIWNEWDKTETFDILYYFDSELNWSSNQLTEMNLIFKPEVIVTDSESDGPHGQVQNSYDHSSSRNQNIEAGNAQLYFNLKNNGEIEIHCLRCIFLEPLVPFNSIFTSSGDDSQDNSEQYIFICKWNLICPCWRLQDPYENGIIRKTFVNFEKIDEFPKPLVLNETRPILPYQEFKKVQKCAPIMPQFQLPATKTVPITEMYSSRSIESIKTSFKYPTPTDHLAKLIPIQNTSKRDLLPKKKDISNTRIKIPLMYNMGIAEENDSSQYQTQTLDIITKINLLEKETQDSVMHFQRIPGTVSDNLYEKDNTPLKSKTLPKSMKDVTCTSSTEFSNSNLMLVENTLVAVNNKINHDETSLLSTSYDQPSNGIVNNSSRPKTSSDWASHVDSSVPTASHERESIDSSSAPNAKYGQESIDEINLPTISSARVSNIKSISSATSSASGWASNVNLSSSVSTISDCVSNDEENSSGPITHSGWKSNIDVKNRRAVYHVNGDDECRLLSAESTTSKKVSSPRKSKEPENNENEIVEAIPEIVITNGNSKSIVSSKNPATKHKLMFSWLKKHPIKQTMMMKYLFRGIGFGLASFGVKPKRLGYTMDGSSMKRKILSFKFKNRFSVPNKVVPIDPMSFRKGVVHEKLFKKRTIRKNHRSHKIIQNFDVQRILPAKILRHNRVVPLPKFPEPKK